MLSHCYTGQLFDVPFHIVSLQCTGFISLIITVIGIFIQDSPSVQSTVINGVFEEGGNRSARRKASKSG